MSDAPRLDPAGFARVAAISFVVVGLVNLAVEVGVYGALLFPRHGAASRVPWYGFLAMYAPVLLACVAVGARLRGVAAPCVAGAAAGVAAALGKAALAWVGAPGHAAGLAATDPARFLAVQVPRMTGGFLVIFVLAAAIARRWAGPPGRSPS